MGTVLALACKKRIQVPVMYRWTMSTAASECLSKQYGCGRACHIAQFFLFTMSFMDCYRRQLIKLQWHSIENTSARFFLHIAQPGHMNKANRRQDFAYLYNGPAMSFQVCHCECQPALMQCRRRCLSWNVAFKETKCSTSLIPVKCLYRIWPLILVTVFLPLLEGQVFCFAIN